MAIVIGDVHGRFAELYYKFAVLEDNDILQKKDIFILGDVNVGFHPDFENETLWPTMNKYMTKLKSMLYIVRGNHDNPMWFDGKHNFKRVKFLQDYSVVKSKDIEGDPIKILILGGGISVNRTSTRMVHGKNWWSNEQFYLDSELLMGMKGIDIIMSHTCPWFCPPTGLNNLILDWGKQDPLMPSECVRERERMDEAYKILIENNKIRRWYYGHFHQSLKHVIGDVEFNCLDELEIKEVWK